MGRTKNSVFNIGSNFIILALKTVLTFVTKTVFIYMLGKEALGLNGLFTNILSMLSLAELGIGMSITFSLYKPIADNDEAQISALMSFYKKCYRIIGFVVIFLGIILVPFLPVFIRNIDTIENVYLIYALYLFNSASSYFISYKQILITASQKKYKLLKIELISIVLRNVIEIVVLVLCKNFVFYLAMQILTNFIERVVINRFITKQFSNINFNSKQKIDEDKKKEISTNVKAMIFHKVGDYCINGTDNLIISSFIDIAMVGIYSNYLTIINLLKDFTASIFNSMIASIGNLIATENDAKKTEVFEKINFAALMIYGFCMLISVNVFNDFIKLWIGESYCLDFIVVIFITLNFYLRGLRVPVASMKEAAGLYDIDKFTPLVQSVVNLVVSIVLVQYIGILGVIVGTTISSLVLPNWQRPYLVYKYVLHRSSKEYFINVLKYTAILFAIIFITVFGFSKIVIENLILALIIKLIVCSLLFVVVMFVIYRNNKEMKFFIETFKKIVKRVKGEI